MSIATEIKAARAKLDFSQSQAAKAWGVSLKTLQAWEQGVNPPRGLSLEMLRLKIASAQLAAKPVAPASSASPDSPDASPPATPKPKEKRARRRKTIR